MSDSESEKKSTRLLREMKLETSTPDHHVGQGHGVARVKVEDADSNNRASTPLAIPPRLKARSKSQSPALKQDTDTASPNSSAHDEAAGGNTTPKREPGKAMRLPRSSSQKVVSRPRPLYNDLPDATEKATATFTVLTECSYANKHIGTTDPALECDCGEEWDSIAKVNGACGEDSDCINRATKMECGGDCSCGRKCQNQRFLRKQYAKVSVIKTEKKGFGLRADRDMVPGDFVFEYVGEVINETTFRKRMIQYDAEGIKHFYFMSLTKGEFVDATKKGNLGRFCNHSCNPNCFVDKWVVGDKLRMGIFVERNVKAGEELVFNYNVDRYGADPQPCYCGEPNCTGYIGGKTQSDDNVTKLSHATIEALGIHHGHDWETVVAKKPRKKKVNEDDEEYVGNIKARELDEDGVAKVMAALRQCTEKWIAVKLLARIQQSDNEKIGHRIIRMHGYETLKKALVEWKEDFNIIKQILDILHKLPRITRNKIQDSKIEEAVEDLKSCGEEPVESSATTLLEEWSKLEMAYRIPRMKRDPATGIPTPAINHFERRERGRERSRSRSKSPLLNAPKGPAVVNAPSGPRSLNAPRGPASLLKSSRPAPRPRQSNPLPAGWFQAISDSGTTYYFNSSGTTQWQRPSQAANQPPPPPPKAKTDTQVLQDLISELTAKATPSGAAATSDIPTAAEETHERKDRSDKWRSLPQDKQEKIYESTISPHVMSVASHYRKKLDKDELKRLSKEVAKKLVRGDYKSGRVKDPTAKLNQKHERTIKHHVKDFMEKAVRKKAERDKQKGQTGGITVGDAVHVTDGLTTATVSNQASPNDLAYELKRKREEDDASGSPKKSRTGTDELPPAPPPPPPPPAEDVAVESVEMEGGSVDIGDGEESIITNGVGSPMQLVSLPVSGSTKEKEA